MYPIFFDFAGVPIRSYDVFTVFGILAGFITLHFSLRKTPAKQYKNTMLFAIIIFIPFIAAALLGSMVEGLISSSDMPKFGTASLWWGLAAAAASSFYIAKKLKISAWETGDYLAPAIAIGFFLVKLGCFLNGCCFGKACSTDFGFPLYYPAGSRVTDIFNGSPVYPAQLMEALAWLAIFIILVMTNIKPGFKGRQILILFILFPLARFVIDFLRYFPEKSGFILSQAWAFIALVTAITAYIIKQKTK